MLKIHSFATITIETISIPLARLKDHKTQKTCIIRASWEPFIIGEGNRMLKIQQSYGGRRAAGGRLNEPRAQCAPGAGRGVVCRVARAGRVAHTAPADTRYRLFIL